MKNIFIVSSLLILTGCAGLAPITQVPASLVQGPPVTANATPASAALQCVSELSNLTEGPWFAVGKVPDLTGRFTNEDGGYKVTQGAQMMVHTALSKIPGVQLVERIDPSVFEFEIKLASQHILGDGKSWDLGKGKKAKWRPIIKGAVQGSDFYVTGAITEVNDNISSGGAELEIDGIGAGARQYRLNVAGDFRIVDTRTLRSMTSISLKKQVVGYEVRANIFSFLGSTPLLVDFNAGVKNDEPLQYAVRTLIETAVAKMLPVIIGGRGDDCVEGVNKMFTKNPTKVLDEPVKTGQEVASMISTALPGENPFETLSVDTGNTNIYSNPRNNGETLEGTVEIDLTTPEDTNISRDVRNMGD